MTRPLVDTAAFLPTSTSGKAQIISDPSNTWVSNVTTYLNNISADLDTANIPSSTGALEVITSGAASLTIPRTDLSTTGTVAYTLADGTVLGQQKIFECTVAASSPQGTLTINTPLASEPATHVFNAVGQRLELVWLTGGWHIAKKLRVGVSPTIVVGTTVLTGFDMNSVYNCSVTGTVSSTSTKAIPSPTVGDEGQTITVTCSVAATCPVGSIDSAYLNTANAAKTHLSVSATTGTAVLVASNGSWRQVVLTTFALS